MKMAKPSLLATTATAAEAPQTVTLAEYSALYLICAEGASTVIGAPVLGHLSTTATILRHLPVAAVRVLEEARERRHVILAMLPWLVGGNGYWPSWRWLAITASAPAWPSCSWRLLGVHSRKQKTPTNLSHDLFYVVVS
jgi:hypothetical protein